MAELGLDTCRPYILLPLSQLEEGTEAEGTVTHAVGYKVYPARQERTCKKFEVLAEVTQSLHSAAL